MFTTEPIDLAWNIYIGWVPPQTYYLLLKWMFLKMDEYIIIDTALRTDLWNKAALVLINGFVIKLKSSVTKTWRARLRIVSALYCTFSIYHGFVSTGRLGLPLYPILTVSATWSKRWGHGNACLHHTRKIVIIVIFELHERGVLLECWRSFVLITTLNFFFKLKSFHLKSDLNFNTS